MSNIQRACPQTSQPTNHHNEIFTNDSSNQWNFIKEGYWIGGLFKVSNLSRGYHGILKQWWDFYISNKLNPKVLLISESQTVKKEFLLSYPEWDIDLIDLYPELYTSEYVKPTIVGDICARINPLPTNTYDLIVSQATLEHVYNPFGAMVNLSNALNKNGIIVSHTHPPGFPYHRYPTDYFRFMKDWWYDLEKYIMDIELMELYMVDNHQVFSCYIKKS